ncbi:CotD family spore coat protein [Lysinibacillus telephonicus]|uniref:Spore coat protein D n=1 Tax=Lysinibacillus telephonicus TaxID=1714840 RepID=A0A431UX64_9BACI|nr:CotD family spore coat protein [Lysinibacillus telephonicus]RTQ96054.1 hypothetical protein EKG35_01415 [Lysinibacillus telephonicus]
MFNRQMGRRRKPICCPPNVLPTQVAPARVSPTQEVVRTNIINTVVPHIHPVHVTTVNRHIAHNQHYFPRTNSVVNQFAETQMNCGTPENPNPNCFPIRRRFY